MRKTSLIPIIFLLLTACKSEEKLSYEQKIKKHQYEMNLEFNDPKKSPLKKEDLQNFSHLDFFKIDPNYKVEARIERIDNGRIFTMPTTTDRLPLYQEYAYLHFQLQGVPCKLTLYKPQDNTLKEYIFLPFTDASNGLTTYDGGRYIDLEVFTEDQKTLELDFNLAYNPYCAYNPNYSCPIPPLENNLEVSVNAGVKKYH